ncbi:murein biosynthesis integral membrane protein MurJ [Cellulomonas sp. C5510]|uniref:murein biosynthesis integral membrane protein MurJ n=1 Tax=Cellulomonas sp. C5510 TaxID=2871170 RepID=UPI001C966ED1|nr:lipid II flippase MurJ [Cellulomonas sp. C5510]QZN84412.1 virulence factor MviN [Cellulomonas sp. C5510]
MNRRGVLSGLAGAAALISVVTIVSRLLGFARTLAFTGNVGITAAGDAYAWANTLPNVLFEVVAGGALAGALIPVLAAPLARGMRDDVSHIASAMLGWTLGGLTLLAVALALAAEPIALLATTRSDAGHDLVVFFLRVFAVQLPLYGLAVVLSGVLQAQRRFFWPAFAPVLSSLVVILTYLGYGAALRHAQVDPASSDVGVLPGGATALLAWGTTAGVLAMGLPMLVPVHRSGVRLRPTLRFPEGVAARARGLALAGVGGLVAQQVAVLATTLWMARRFGGDGTLTAYQQVVQAVYLLPYAVLAVPLATSTFPRLAERAARPGREGYAPLAAVTTRAVLVAGAVGAAVLAAAAPAVARAFVAIGTGDERLIASVDVALTLIAPGLLGLGLIFHLSRALYALERGRLAVLAVSGGWAAVVAASWVACVVMVPPGAQDGPATLRALALGNTTGMVVAGILLLLAVRSAAGAGAIAGTARTLAVLVLGGVAGAVAGRWTVDAVQRFTEGLGAAVGAAAGGGALAASVVVGAVWLLDRSTVTGLLRRRRSPGAAHGAPSRDAAGVATGPAAAAAPRDGVPGGPVPTGPGPRGVVPGVARPGGPTSSPADDGRAAGTGDAGRDGRSEREVER